MIIIIASRAAYFINSKITRWYPLPITCELRSNGNVQYENEPVCLECTNKEECVTWDSGGSIIWVVKKSSVRFFVRYFISQKNPFNDRLSCQCNDCSANTAARANGPGYAPALPSKNGCTEYIPLRESLRLWLMIIISLCDLPGVIVSCCKNQNVMFCMKCHQNNLDYCTVWTSEGLTCGCDTCTSGYETGMPELYWKVR